MKKVVMLVAVEVEVSEDVDTTLLGLGNSLDDILIEECGKKVDAKVNWFRTERIFHNESYSHQ